jgi:hypothetical protein
VQVGSDAIADAGEHRAFADEIQPLRGACASLRAASAACVAADRCAVDRSHLLDDLVDLPVGDDRLVRGEIPAALLGDRLLEVRDDFGAVRIVFELTLRPVEVGDQSRLSSLFDLVRMAVQTDGNDLLHVIVPAG